MREWSRRRLDASQMVPHAQTRATALQLLQLVEEGIQLCSDSNHLVEEAHIRCYVGSRSRHWRGVETGSSLRLGNRYCDSDSLVAPRPHILKVVVRTS